MNSQVDDFSENSFQGDSKIGRPNIDNALQDAQLKEV